MIERVPIVGADHRFAVEPPRCRSQKHFAFIRVGALHADAGLRRREHEFRHLEHHVDLLSHGHLAVNFDQDLERLRVGIGEEVGVHFVYCNWAYCSWLASGYRIRVVYDAGLCDGFCLLWLFYFWRGVAPR